MTDTKNDERTVVLLGVTYYRSDLAAEMLGMHRNTLLEKARLGLIRKYRYKHAVWFTALWMKMYIDKVSR